MDPISERVKPVQPFSTDIRQKYGIAIDEPNLGETPEDPACPKQYSGYYSQNFKRQFYIEQQPNSEPAEFDDEYVLTVYEVDRLFPTMTMIQTVSNTFVKKIPRVEYQIKTVELIYQEIQQALRIGEVEEVIKKYITNDDVGGGLPKILDTFFKDSKEKEQQFKELVANRDQVRLSKGYLTLYLAIEKCMNELSKCVEQRMNQDPDMAKMALERMEERNRHKERVHGLY